MGRLRQESKAMRTRAVTMLLLRIGGGLVMAAVLYLVLAAPGFLSDRDSTVPLVSAAEER